jgi:DNA-directed RNA polymerase specialized sigma24 family protein
VTLQRAHDGDSPAALTASLIRRGLPRDLAEDSAQEALLILHKKPRSFASAEHRRNWLMAVARHEALRELARRNREVPRAEAAVVVHDPDLALVMDARRALASLPADKALPLLAVASGWSYDELSERLGRTYSWVNRGVSEGRALARRQLAA